MIGVEFKGRLGNQLFQYTFYRYLKLNYKGIAFFSNPHHAYISKYFKLSPIDDIILGSKLYSALGRSIPKVLGFTNVDINNLHVPKILEPIPWSIYKGYYQSDWYLKQLNNSLNIKIRKRYINAFSAKYDKLFQENRTIVVHVRRTDYLKYGKRDISLPLEYFKRRLNCIENVEQYKVIFVSDDLEAVKSYFPKKGNYIFAANQEIIDFQLIMNADIAIISNSSFSWWAAYLSSKNNLVYAPKDWLGFRIGKEHPKMIMTNRFIWCSVFDQLGPKTSPLLIK